MSLTNGTRLGPYEILAPIGAGGMGEVYKARDTRLGRDVAVKVLPSEFASDPERLRRFEQEARATAALDHPNILAVFDIGNHEGTHFIVEQLLEGESLRHRLQSGPLTPAKAVEFGIQIANGLAAAYEKGIVHRDLKPENLWITKDGRIKILDFGLARLEPTDSLPEKGESQVLTADLPTRQGTVLGTAGYMAPEQVRGQACDHRSDLFAFGCVLYEMVSGRRAFTGETYTDVSAAILRDDPADLMGLAPKAPPALAQIVKRCIEKRTQDRFSSALDLAFALEAIARWPEPGKTPGGWSTNLANDRPSVAVLPFTNMSADPEQEYFCDGMAEEIINALAHVNGLRVVARTSAFAAKGKREDARQIGERLGAQALLEGSVRKAGNRVRITTQLVDVATGYHLWSERFDRGAEEVFSIQDEISLVVVDKLKVTLLAGERASLLGRHTECLEAHETYLKGLFEWNTMTPEGFARCQDLYRQAIRLDPDYAPPYAQLADSFTSVTWWADLPPAQALAQALPLAEKALALDPGLSHAYSVVGHIRAFFQRDLAGGERHLRKAVELAPNGALAQTYLALLLVARRGQEEEAAARARLALQLDPLSPPINAWAGIVLVFSGFEDEGLGRLKQQVAATPHLWMPQYFLSVALASNGRAAEGREAAERSLVLSGGSSLTLSQAAAAAYGSADQDRGDALFGQLELRSQSRYVSPTLLARLCLQRKEPDKAYALFHRALEANDPLLFNQLISRGVMEDARIEALIKENLS